MIPRARREAVQQAARHETLPADHRRISRLALRESAKTRLAELDKAPSRLVIGPTAGLGDRLQPQIAWAKFYALCADSAAIAIKKLWIKFTSVCAGWKKQKGQETGSKCL